MTIPDPTEEIKAIRHRLGAAFDYDLDRIVADIQRRQTESGHNYVTMPAREIADIRVRTAITDGPPHTT